VNLPEAHIRTKASAPPHSIESVQSLEVEKLEIWNLYFNKRVSMILTKPTCENYSNKGYQFEKEQEKTQNILNIFYFVFFYETVRCVHKRRQMERLR